MEASATKEIRLLVELDALQDTRIATLAILNPSYASKVLSGNYLRRLSDEFHLDVPGLKEQEYKEAYAKRDVTTLQNSLPTPVVFLLSDTVKDIERDIIIGHPIYNNVRVEVNVYPYQLTDEEKFLIAEAVKENSGLVCAVECVNIPYKNLTTDYIRNADYGALIIYNFRQWLYESLEGLTDKPNGVPDVSLIVPALLDTRATAADEKLRTLPNGKTLDPFDSVTHTLSYLIGCRFIDAANYSLVNVMEKP